MGIERLNRAVNLFTDAVKHLMVTESEAHVIAHFAKSPLSELELILEVCEQMEEYEICHIVSNAVKHKQHIAA